MIHPSTYIQETERHFRSSASHSVRPKLGLAAEWVGVGERSYVLGATELVLQEDLGLLMYYDNTLIRAEEQPVQGRLL